MNKESTKLHQKIKLLTIINVIILIFVVVSMFPKGSNQEVRIDYNKLSDMIVEKLEAKEDLEHEKIEAIVNEIQQEKMNEIEEVENTTENNYKEKDKDFAEQFGEVSNYIGGQIKETWDVIVDKINE